MKRTILIFNMILLTLLTGCKKYSESETFLIPDNYTGTIVIIYNQDTGNKKDYQDDRRLYRVPSDGILYTQFEKPKEILSQEFYYKNNRSKEIKRIVLESNLNNSEVYILDMYDGESSVLPKDGVKYGNISDYPTIKWSYFTIGKPSIDRDSLRDLGNKVINRIVKGRQ